MVKFASFSCLHAPITDKTYFNWLITQLEDFQPDYVINLGDWYEAKPAKRFSKWADEVWTVLDEHREVARQASEINRVLPNSKRVLLFGNHDDNFFGENPDRIESDVRAALHWKENKDTSVALKDWKVIEEYSHRTKFKLGPVTFQHGCDVAMNSMVKASYLYSIPNGLYVCGHTHRPCPVTQVSHLQVPLPYWYANPGCGADWDKMHYMKRLSMANWGRGLVIGEVHESAVSSKRSFYSANSWNAETIMHSFACENKHLTSHNLRS